MWRQEHATKTKKRESQPKRPHSRKTYTPSANTRGTIITTRAQQATETIHITSQMHSLGGTALLATKPSTPTSGGRATTTLAPATVEIACRSAEHVFHTVQHERFADLNDVHMGHLTAGLEHGKLVGFPSLIPVVPPFFRNADFPPVLEFRPSRTGFHIGVLIVASHFLSFQNS